MSVTASVATIAGSALREDIAMIRSSRLVRSFGGWLIAGTSMVPGRLDAAPPRAEEVMQPSITPEERDRRYQ